MDIFRGLGARIYSLYSIKIIMSPLNMETQRVCEIERKYLKVLLAVASIYTVKKKYFQDLLSQHFFFCQINLNNLFS